MLFVGDRSKWRWETSGGAGVSIDVVALSGGVLKLYDPAGQEQVFHYGGVGAGISTPGLKIPKLGGLLGRLIGGRALNGSGGPTSLWNDGAVYRGTVIGNRELTREDLRGPCLMGDIGLSTPFKGRSFGAFLCGLSPEAFAALTNPALMLIDTLRHVGPYDAKAFIVWQGDTRGLVLGGTVYAGLLG